MTCILLLLFLFILFLFVFELAHNQYFILSQESMDNITLFSIITVMSFFLLAPVALFKEGVKVTPAYLQSAVSTFLRAKSCYKFFVGLILLWKSIFNVGANLIHFFYIINSMTGIKCSTSIHQVFYSCTLLPCLSTGEALCMLWILLFLFLNVFFFFFFSFVNYDLPRISLVLLICKNCYLFIYFYLKYWNQLLDN
jgi:hypothetical protein